ncbi:MULTISPECIES: hypothetical protein [Haloarcula]|uniref:hypothetical protein n=1 Tax=Haloarcula TaxID=2237 RepID=UPI0023ED29C5|nr:hypothetical protein [Halomicroarcula sp. XH51]
MAYYWLNQKGTDGSNYNDEVGEVYHYRGNTPGAQQLTAGDRFVYYRVGQYELFGAGEISHIDKRESGNGSGVTTDYFAHITNYTAFEPPVILKGIGDSGLKDEISFLCDRPGLTGVPQHSIHQICEEDFQLILDSAGVEFND